LQQHRDEFSQFIWKRRLASKKEMQLLFQAGPGMLCRFGDMIADSTLESLEAFERNNWARLCRDGINWGLCNSDDIPLYFNRKIYLVAPRVPARATVHPNRLELHLPHQSRSDPFPEATPPPVLPPQEWACAYSTAGPWSARLMARPMIKNIVAQTFAQLRLNADAADAAALSYVQILARLVDAIHPSHQLQATVLAHPLYGPSILRRRLVALGYDVGPGGEESNLIDGRLAVDIVKQLNKRLEKEHRFYLEFSTPDNAAWRAGFSVSNSTDQNDHTRYPGQDEFSFGFGSDGSVLYNGESYRYIDDPQDPLFFMGFRTWGLLVDLFHGSISLVVDNKTQPVAFGHGSVVFDDTLNLRIAHIPGAVVEAQSEYAERTQVRVNFGDRPFSYSIIAQPCDAILHQRSSKGIDSLPIVDGMDRGDGVGNAEEEDNLHMVDFYTSRAAAEKNYFRASLVPEGQKCFSQFPPSIYRKSLACTRIQRVWRRYRGRSLRNQIREEQYAAATLIQSVARRKLRLIRARKHSAAALIQKFWRRRMFIWVALLRCMYQQPIPELHRSATVIQRKWRNWSVFRNSPIATRYNARIEDIIRAVIKITRWWRPLHLRMTEIKRLRQRHEAATVIQRVYRGYYLRQLLRPELRHRLQRLGKSVAEHRSELYTIRAAYVLQKAWRRFVARRIRADKVRTRHSAAARLQAFWKGYWVRSHIHLRFTYGEAVFLTAVCKALRNCHFILKMYKPCGIVCPRRDNT
ncbi:hypothetical protein BDK51DRAFT_15469, partial [Blyttiomyces helicus]